MFHFVVLEDLSHSLPPLIAVKPLLSINSLDDDNYFLAASHRNRKYCEMGKTHRRAFVFQLIRRIQGNFAAEKFLRTLLHIFAVVLPQQANLFFSVKLVLACGVFWYVPLLSLRIGKTAELLLFDNS